MKQPEVAICGSADFLVEMADILEGKGEKRVSRLEGGLPDALQEINMLYPDVVIFEMGTSLELLSKILQYKLPQITFMGIQQENQSMVIFAGSNQTRVSLDKLEYYIRGDDKKND